MSSSTGSGGPWTQPSGGARRIDRRRAGRADHRSAAGVDAAGLAGPQRPLYPALVAQQGAEVASALEILHGKGVLHLALIPENVRFDGTAKVIGQGTGVVRVSTGHSARDAVASALPRYVAPEFIRGEPIGYGVDMYALGVRLYEACAGVPPFVGRLTEVLSAHQHLQPGYRRTCRRRCAP